VKVLRKQTPSGKWLAVIVCTEQEARVLIDGQDSLAFYTKNITPERKKEMETIRACLVEAAYGKMN
jgi:hypothetical protein